MFVVSLYEVDRVLDVYDTEVFLDEGVEVFPITPEEQLQIWHHGATGDFRYIDGKVVLDPKTEQAAAGAFGEVAEYVAPEPETNPEEPAQE